MYVPHLIMSDSNAPKSALPVLMLGALGVVYGDIGTSPLYAIKEAFSGPHAAGMQHVMGVLSMVFWLLMVSVTGKYISLVLRADNKGEGGNFSLLALNLRLTAQRPWLHYGIGLLGILGGCLFYADAMITPAISVLSAVEGLGVYYDRLDKFVIPIALLILISLFVMQRFGTGHMGALFGPITLIWFSAIGFFGIASILETPEILGAISPHYVVSYIFNYPHEAFLTAAAAMLVITGAEALYADMGHFGRRPIRYTWMFVGVMLVASYFGQGALLIRNPEVVNDPDFSPFFMIVPESVVLPVVVLATLATIVASQAMISGAFSMTRQAIQLGYIPRMRIIHTSHAAMGQIYIPLVNWLLLAGVILAVLMFQTSSGLASAYGIAVMGTMVVTTSAMSIVMVKKWHWNPWVAFVLVVLLWSVELPLFAANLTKVATGGWLPLLVALVLFTLLTSWFRGQRILAQTINEHAVSVREFADDMVKQNYRRVPGTAVYMTPRKHAVPQPLLMNLKFNKILHETVILMTLQITNEPTVDVSERYDIQELSENFFRVVLRYGFTEEPNLEQDLKNCRHDDHPLLEEDVVFFLGHETIVPTPGSGMAVWREQLYAWMKRNAVSAVHYYGVPSERVMEIGGQYDI
jgi:KUP system potassium uptake protein